MDDFLLVAILNGGDNLAELGSGLFLFHAAMEDQVVEDFASRGIFHDQVQRLLRLDHLEELDNVGVVESLHDPHLAEQFLQGAGVQLRLVDDFDGHLLAGGNVLG